MAMMKQEQADQKHQNEVEANFDPAEHNHLQQETGQGQNEQGGNTKHPGRHHRKKKTPHDVSKQAAAATAVPMKPEQSPPKEAVVSAKIILEFQVL
jgi:hypothetical protein